MGPQALGGVHIYPRAMSNNHQKFFGARSQYEGSGRFSTAAVTASLNTSTDAITLPLQVDEAGRLKVVSSLGGSSSATSVAFTTALTGSLQVKSSAGAARQLLGRIDSAAGPSQTFYLQMFNSSTTVASGTLVATSGLCAPLKLVYTSGTDLSFSRDFTEAGVAFSNGMFVALSSNSTGYVPVTGSWAAIDVQYK